MFEGLPRHGATLLAMHVEWREGACVPSFKSSRGSVEINVIGLKDIAVPPDQSRGPSSSVNEMRERDGRFEIEMQSGDVLRVRAESWRAAEQTESSAATLSDSKALVDVRKA